MKLTLLSLLILLSTFDLFAQIEKGNVLISASGNYRNDKKIEIGNKSTMNALNTGASVGYFFSNRLVAGGGLDYKYQKEVPYYETNQSLQITVNGYFPYLYVGYYLPIVPKLYFNTNLKVSLGQDTGTAIDQNPYKYTVETNYLEAQVTPELTYFFLKRVGASVGLGGLSYIKSKSMNAENHNWLVNFNPSYWKIGIKVVL